MSEEETITVAEISEGPGGTNDLDPGSSVELPVVDILTGRGFVTGKSGSGKSNSISVIIENLLDENFPMLVVDSDGEYYGLKEAYEVLHVGADEECDIQVSPEHAERIATLALEENVPIILDVSGYLDDDVAHELLLETAKHLFAKEKKLKKPFLLVVEECHEYLPEKGGMGEAGKMLIKIGKRGRKHGLGIVGISQRPADVKKDFITQCDWLVWHRLTWQNDTKVVRRILGSEYAEAIEELDDGEGFLVADFSESIRRVQFHRKRTFDAGATPGLEDFERPELKSVSDDLVSELETISDEKQRRESEIADLKQELELKNAEIERLQDELEEAKDLSRMADRFAQALLGRAEARAARRSEPDPERPDPDPEQPDPDPERPEALRSDPSKEPPSDVDASADEADSTSAERSDEDEFDEIEALGSLGTVSREEIAEEAMRFAEAVELGTRQAVVEELTDRIETVPDYSVEMLNHYREERESDPLAAHVATGGEPDQQLAYSRHRPLRQAGLVRHLGRGEYEYAIPDLIREAYAHGLSESELDEMVAAVESTFVEEVEDPRNGRERFGSPGSVFDPQFPG